MNKDEALKMAIEWFEGLIEANAPIYDEERLIFNACKEALEQPNNEKKSIMQPTYFEKTIAGEYIKASPQPVRIEQPEIKLADGISIEEWHQLREPKASKEALEQNESTIKWDELRNRVWDKDLKEKNHG